MNDQTQPDKTASECLTILDQNRECPLADTLLSFHEDELAPGDAAAVAAHLGSCPECARLIERLEEAESPMPMAEDAAYRTAREEDRAQTAKALGFRVGRPPARPLLERFSWLWQTRVPVPVPAAAFAMLALVILWPARPESPVTALTSEVPVISTDLENRTASEVSPAAVNDVLKIRHTFLNSHVEAGTMVNIEVKGPKTTTHLEPVSVVMITDGENSRPGISLDLTIDTPGNYLLRLSNPQDAFSPVTLKLEIHAD